ncbi:hypothetical protein [Cetobacterium somerae]
MKKINYKNEFEEIANLFYKFDIDKVTDNKIKKLNTELKKKNDDYIAEIKALKTKINQLESKTESTNFSYDSIYISLKKKFSFLNEKSLQTLSTGEYLYRNERIEMDYTGVYIYYIKALEIEIKEYISSNNKSTLGFLIENLEKFDSLAKFCQVIKKNRILEVRNKAVHSIPITKHECGKLRKILFEDKWLDNLVFILQEFKQKSKQKKIIKNEFSISCIEGYQKYLGKNYICYCTSENEYILSLRSLKFGHNDINGYIEIIDNIEYLIAR